MATDRSGAASRARSVPESQRVLSAIYARRLAIRVAEGNSPRAEGSVERASTDRGLVLAVLPLGLAGLLHAVLLVVRRLRRGGGRSGRRSRRRHRVLGSADARAPAHHDQG